MAKIILTEMCCGRRVAKRIVDTNLTFKSIGNKTSVFSDEWLFTAAESIEEVNRLINETEKAENQFISDKLDEILRELKK